MALWSTQRKTITYPAGVDPTRNGQLTHLDLAPVVLPGIGVGLLEAHAAQAWRCLAMYFHNETSQQLTMTGGGAYRSLHDQETLFQQRFTTATDPKLLTVPLVNRVWNGQVWHLRRGNALAATPGKSNHGLGLAGDMALWVQGTDGSWSIQGVTVNRWAFAWLEAHVAEFGFAWNVSSEPWHLEYVVGNATPERIRQTLAYFGEPVL